MNRVRDDELVMSLADNALSRQPETRAEWLRTECGDDSELFREVQGYLTAEAALNHFLERPFAADFPWLSSRADLQAAPDNHIFCADELVAGRVRIVRHVAEGGMGVVYEAQDERLHRRVAIKCAKSGFGSRLPPEVRHASEISHPNVCRIYDIHSSSNSRGEIDFITMEFLDGHTLAERLCAGPVPRCAAQQIASQLCDGLAEAHRHQVVHGDLKSNNVIMKSDPTSGTECAVITDFGLARAPENLTGTYEQRMASAPVGGSLAYIAPELFRGAKPSAASDIYALGVIFCELNLGRRPTAGGRGVCSINSKLFRSKWNGVIARCLNPDPRLRFANGDALRRALRPPLTQRWILGAATAAGLAALISGTITFQRSSAPKRTVRLAFLPLEFGSVAAPLAPALSREIAGRLASLRGDSKTNVEFVSLNDRGPSLQVDTIEKARTALKADFVLHGSLAEEGNRSAVLHAYLTDSRSGVNKEEWILRYEPGQVRYAPTALAGMVTNSLNLPPLVRSETVNAAARKGYFAGLSYIKHGSHCDDALDLLQGAVAADPESPLSYAALAEAQSWKSRVTGDPAWSEKARESVRQAELRNPDLPQVHMISGWLQKIASHYEIAEVHFLRVIQLEPANADAWRRLGDTYDKRGRTNEALSALRKAVELQPDDFRNRRELGVFYYQHDQPSDAVVQYQRLVSLSPGLADSHSLLGEAYSELSNLRAAEDEYRNAIGIQDTSFAEQALGALFWEVGRNDEAIAHYLRASALGPETSSLWLSLSWCYHGYERNARKAWQRGLTAAGKALAEDPRNAREHATQAYFEAKLGDAGRAESDIRQALRLAQDDNTKKLAVLTYSAIGRQDQALNLLESSQTIAIELSRYPGTEALRRQVRFNSPCIKRLISEGVMANSSYMLMALYTA